MTTSAARKNSTFLVVSAALIVACAAVPGHAQTSDIQDLLRCQKQFAKHGARFASKTIKHTLKCTNEIVECQINCDNGVYGPPCSTNPPPCCDPDDPGSNSAYQACLDDADETCARETLKIQQAEDKKTTAVFAKCSELSTEELCGASTPGLNFLTLNAGCEELIPGYTCTLTNLLECVGGPLEQQLGEQIAELLDPRAGEALTAAGNSSFSGIARVFKLKGELEADKVDIYSINGLADDRIVVSVQTRPDNGGADSSLEPIVTYLSPDGMTPVGDTSVVGTPCSAPSTCGSTCPQFKRRFPVSGTFYLAVQASSLGGCGSGRYAIVVKTESGFEPVQVADDVDLAVVLP